MSGLTRRLLLLAGGIFLWFPGPLVSQSTIILRPKLVDEHPEATFNSHRELLRPKIALVLSGGGARGIAQIGVLKSLERHGIPVDFVAGTSLGSVVGGLYAAGYSTAELESLVLSLDWDELLSLTEETKRRELFLDQKLANDRSFLVVRFDGLEPVIPSAVSSGQRLTNFLSTQALQALYHPEPSFDDLKIRFRAVTTDLISGKRIVLQEGSLAEALRASTTVPLLFNPVQRSDMQLIDGGLVTNIPVDIAAEEGYDIIIAVNSTSGLRSAEELKAPWQTADQIMGIMMQASNEQQLQLADVVITPDIGKHLSSNFNGLDSLIAAGEHAAEQKISEILALYKSKTDSVMRSPGRVFSRPVIRTVGSGLPPEIRLRLKRQAASAAVTEHEVQEVLRAIYAHGDYNNVFASISTGDDESVISYVFVRNPVVHALELRGCHNIPPEFLRPAYSPVVDNPLNHHTLTRAMEDILRLYRSRGYSLARITSTMYDDSAGILHMEVNEGVISRIEVAGNERTEDEFVLRDFPLQPGDVFQIDKANRGITNIASTNLFEFVYLEVSHENGSAVLTIRLGERPSQLVRLGFRADNERSVQGSIDIRDENFRGTATELGLRVGGGNRNSDVRLEYKAPRLFDTYLTIGASIFHNVHDTYLYDDAPVTTEDRWDRVRVGEYRDVRYGARLAFGSLLERLGNATIELSYEHVRTKNLSNALALEDDYRLAVMRFGTIVDTKDIYPFPQRGLGVEISYELSLKAFGSQLGYNALHLVYEIYSTFGERHTIHPKLTLGFADRTMPLAQQYRLGGRESFFGTREDDRRGRQLLLMNMEYRYRLPFKIIFDAFLSARYDLATISTEPEQIKFRNFRHGVGTELALETPVGPAALGLGQSFYFGRNLPENPVLFGPFVFYMMIGYQL